MAEIVLQNIQKNFGDFTAVENSNLKVETGEFFVMLGPSGCGKTTTLRMIAGLEIPTSGNIMLDNKNVTSLRASQRDIAFVFQLFALYPHLNVEKNIGIKLTESYAMYPAASVCGLYFSHPLSKYFSIGIICQDQIKDYAKRKNINQTLIEKLLSLNLS